MPTITGTNGNDTLTGTDGSDTINPLLGKDTVDGLGGEDTLIVDYSSASIDPYAGATIADVPSIVSSNGGSFSGVIMTVDGGNFVTFSNIEHLQVKLDFWQNTFILDGGAIALGATVVLDGGAGTDTLDANLSALASVDLQYGAGGTTASFGTIISFEAFRLNLTEGADHVTTGAGKDRLTGNGGDDVLSSGAGDDILSGGAGSNILNAGDGDDQITSAGIDTVDGGSGYDRWTGDYGFSTANFSIVRDHAAGTATLSNGTTLSGIEQIAVLTTGSGNDTFTFTTSEGALIAAGAGEDTLNLTGNGFFGSISADGPGAFQGSLGNDRFSGIEHLNFVSSANSDSISVNAAPLLSGATLSLDAAGGTDTLAIDFTAFAQTSFVVAADGTVTTNAAATLSNFEIYQVTTSAGDDTITTGDGNDVVHANGGSDVIDTAGGNDLLDGGSGGDAMAGGAGNDIYIVDDSGDTITENAGEGIDEIRTGLTSFSMAALADVENLTGTGAAGQSLTGNGANNSITAGSGNDSIFGGAGADTMLGWSGDDILDGGAGRDVMIGGEGNDTFYVDDEGDQVIEATYNPGNDIAYVGTTFTLGFGQSVETLVATDAAAQVTGNEIANTMLGGVGNNVLNGGGGNDVIDGGVGQDMMTGGFGNDTFYVDDAGDQLFESTDEGNDIAYVGTTFTLGAGQSVETLVATVATAAVTGNELANTLLGGAGNNVLNGGGGNDRIDGGAGQDLMSGGDGNDIYFVDEAGDSVVEGANAGTDEIRTALATYSLAGLDNVENLTGTASGGQILGGHNGANLIVGGSGNDLLDGRGGDDRLRGGLGADYIVGGDGGDQLYGEAGDDLIGGQDGNDLIDGGIGDDRLYGDNGFDYIVAGAGNDQAYGQDGDDIIGGQDGDDLIDGGAGFDRLYGDAGADTILGGDTGDELYGQSGNDRLEGGSGDDLLDGGDNDDRLFGGAGFDHLVGGLGNDQLAGEANDDLLEGGDGDDLLDGGIGVDRLFGGNGADYLVGGAGTDQLYGEAGDDTIGGEDGDDIIDGGDGADHLYGDSGFDHIVGGLGNDFLYGQGDDDVIGGQDGDDVIDGGDGADKLFGDAGNDQVVGGAGNDQLYGQAGNDVLGGDDGNDLLDGGDGADQLNGGLGDDYILAGAGTDTVAAGAGNDIVGGELGDDVLDGGDGDDQLFGDDGNDYIVGGTGNDLLYGQAGNDIIGGQDGNDTIDGGDGSDQLYGDAGIDQIFGGAGLDQIFGQAGDDILLGGDGDDMIDGGDGNDRLDGGVGHDTLVGGAGTDTFAFTTTPAPGNSATLIDFLSGTDKISLAGASGEPFAALASGALAAGTFVIGSAALDANDYLIFNSTSGALLYDADGNGAGAAVQFASLGAGVSVTAADFIVSGPANTAPVITSGATASIAENSPASTIVYQVAASDADGDRITYSLTGADASRLTIDAGGAVRLLNPADFETKASYSFNVVASDSAVSTAKAVTLTITDVTEASNSVTINETSAPNDSTGAAQAIDRATFTIASNPNLPDDHLPSAVILGSISTNADKDFFSITLQAGEQLILDVDGTTTLDSFLTLYGPNGQEIGNNDDLISPDPGSGTQFGHNTDSQILFRAAVSGTYYFSIASFADDSGPTSNGSYQLNVSIGPPATAQQLVREDVDALLSGTSWNHSAISFGFPTAASQYPASFAEAQNGFLPFTSTQQAATVQLLQLVANVASVTFQQLTADPGSADIRYAMSNEPDVAYAYYPTNNGPSSLGGTAWFNHDDFNNPIRGDYAWMGILHESGHALGLKHGHEFPIAISADRDSVEYSVMTYRSYPGGPTTGYTNEQWGYPQTLMMYDVAALQKIYGANYGFNAGNSVYSWSPTSGEMSINGVGQGAPGNGAGGAANRVFMTIWDGGGTDTYDLSNYSANLTIDLRPGEWTRLDPVQLANLDRGSHFARGNVANALLFQDDPRSLIENAIGGSGSDTIYANQAANQLTGNAGSDTFRWAAASHAGTGALADTITDFVHGSDKINLADVDAISGTSDNEAFTFIDTSAFHNVAGELRYEVTAGSAHIFADLDGNGIADMEIVVNNVTSLTGPDFVF